LAGLLYCGDCGQPMVRKTTTYSVKNMENTLPTQKYSYFVCQGQSNEKSCSWHRIREKDLLDAVLQSVNLHIRNVLDTERALRDIDTAPSVQFMVQKYEGHIEKKEQELQKAEKLKVGIYEDLKDGLLDKAEYLKLKQEFDKRIEDATDAIRSIRKEILALQENHSEYYAWMDYFKEFGELEELTRWAAAITINRILVFEDNRIKIVFNFEDAFMQAQELLKTLELDKEA
ncbi:MAG: zinc ribbon domain-containing protein, partial [Parabacteroides sp.]|nr:zinc ribbon domain-containing protein [Parabacteroides sp.]